MKMRVAGIHAYAVKIPNRLIYNEEGDELEGLAVESRRLILISPRVTPERREEVLGHELQHAWEFHVPPATTEEQRCQLFTTIAQQMRQDIEEQGGIESLRELKSQAISLPYREPPIKHQAEAADGFNTDRWECGCCGAQTMCGSIGNGHVELHEGLNQYQVQRWFRCEVCASLNVWREVATSDGRPTGMLVQVPAPKMLRGREAAEFLHAMSAEAGAVVG